jgi:hypothetical protein
MRFTVARSIRADPDVSVDNPKHPFGARSDANGDAGAEHLKGKEES